MPDENHADVAVVEVGMFDLHQVLWAEVEVAVVGVEPMQRLQQLPAVIPADTAIPRSWHCCSICR